MNPFDKIKTRDNDEFPFEEFIAYPHLFLVDWRESEDWIAKNFLRAAGLPDHETTWQWNETEQRGSYISHGRNYPVSPSNGLSAQHAAVKTLQEIHAAGFSIRLLNHAVRGDTAYFVTETPATWKALEKANPLVRWFFTPLPYLYDSFENSYEDLSEAGRRYAEGEAPQPSATIVTGDSRDKTFLNECRTRVNAERDRSKAVPSADRLRIPAPLARLNNHPLRTVYDEQPVLFEHGQVVWAHVVQANSQLHQFGEMDLPAAFVFALDSFFDGNPQTLGEIAKHLFAQKGSASPDPAVAEIARIITSESEMVFNLPVPRQATGGREVFFTTAMVHRNHLPNWVLKGSQVPFLVAPANTRASMILPHRYWPYKLWQ